MSQPAVGSNYFQERAGVLQVASLLNDFHLVFRETPNADVGIDGQIELVDDEGNATGLTVAAQIKSGSSYFRGDGNAIWKFYPIGKHRTYWERYPLPVVLMLHDPKSGEIYWVDVRRQLRSDQYTERFIAVPKSNRLSTETRERLFESFGASGSGLDSVETALRKLALTRISHSGFRLSHLDIFLEGLSDIGRKVFFSVGMCWDLAELRLPPGSAVGVGMGSDEQAFLDQYINYIVGQSLVVADYSDFLIDIVDRQMYPTFYAPLTSRGRAVRDLSRSLSSVGSPGLTEAPIGLLRDIRMLNRAKANAEVANQILAHFESRTQ